MLGIVQEARSFRRQKEEDAAFAGQMVAFRLATGVDLDAAASAQGEGRARLILRVKRLVERERLKGARRHWSYDLNRHIALKQALDRLQRTPAEDRGPS